MKIFETMKHSKIIEVTFIRFLKQLSRDLET